MRFTASKFGRHVRQKQCRGVAFVNCLFRACLRLVIAQGGPQRQLAKRLPGLLQVVGVSPRDVAQLVFPARSGSRSNFVDDDELNAPGGPVFLVFGAAETKVGADGVLYRYLLPPTGTTWT